MNGAVTRDMRHSKAAPCPVCEGGENMVRGKGRRCIGFTSQDRDWVHCSREELAGGITQNDALLFAHKMHGECKCGSSHGPAREAATMLATYDYRDEHKNLLFQVVRKAGKKFLQRRPDGDGWVWTLSGTRRVPYLLPELIAADPTAIVFIVEGEKDVETARALGMIATCNPGGEGKWHFVEETAKKVLAGRTVVVIADADEVGRKHARKVAASLQSVARSVRIIECPAPHKDLTDWVYAGAQVTDVLTHSQIFEGTAITAEDWVEAEVETESSTKLARPRYRIWTPEEIWAPLPDPEYAIDGLLLRASLALVVATGSSLKTWMADDLVIALATGGMWLERFSCKPGAALFVDWESGDYEKRRRLQAIAKARGLEGPVAGVEFITMPDLFFTSEDFGAVVEELAAARQLLAFDSLAAGSVDVDENDARFAKGLQTLKRVAERTGCTMVVLHHSRKAREGGDAREAPRGTGAIYAACDVVLQLERHKSEGFVVTQTKARGGKAVDPFVLRVADLQNGGVRVFSAELDEDDDRDVAKEVRANVAALDRAKQAIIRLLAAERDLTTQNAVYRRVKGKKQTFIAAFEELREDPAIVAFHEGNWRLKSEVAR